MGDWYRGYAADKFAATACQYEPKCQFLIHCSETVLQEVRLTAKAKGVQPGTSKVQRWK